MAVVLKVSLLCDTNLIVRVCARVCVCVFAEIRRAGGR